MPITYLQPNSNGEVFSLIDLAFNENPILVGFPNWVAPEGNAFRFQTGILTSNKWYDFVIFGGAVNSGYGDITITITGATSYVGGVPYTAEGSATIQQTYGDPLQVFSENGLPSYSSSYTFINLVPGYKYIQFTYSVTVEYAPGVNITQSQSSSGTITIYE